MQTEAFLSSIDDDQLAAAIEQAEKSTSGEIRVFISRQKTNDAMAAAGREFVKLGMQNTADRNGVLIFVAPASQTFAIVGDSGIHQKCGNQFWNAISSNMSSAFREGKYTEGLVQAILESGKALGQYFPYQNQDKNELPNSVVRD